MIDKLAAIQEGLRLWRGVVLVLTIIMLLISIIGDDEMSIIVLIICFIALILFQLRNLPVTSYQLFILLQLAYFIFLVGKLLQVFYESPQKAFGATIKTAYFMITLGIFMTILWRHYQKDQLLAQMNIEVNGQQL